MKTRFQYRTLAALLVAAACSTPAPTPAPAPAPTAGPQRGGGGANPVIAPAPDTAAPAPGGGRGGRGAQGGGAQGGGGGGAGGALADPNPQPYGNVVTGAARTRDGLFKVHRVGARWLLEVPRAQLGKDLLLVTEIKRTVLGTGYGGQSLGNRVLRWERRDNRVYLQGVSYDAVATPGRPEFRAVQDANVNPIIAVFNVEAYGADSAVVLDIGRLFTAPPAEIGVQARVPGTVDATRSWIEKIVPFPDNVNAEATLTFAQQVAGGGRGAAAPAPGGRGGAPTNNNPSNTIVMSWSFHKLPETPMMGRLCDDRVGYFARRATDYTDLNQQVKERCFITRYRLEKRDPAAAISDPVKPIVYYVDPSTPTKWVEYIKKGIEDWKPAFEAAGFRNAIVAREAPNDPDWSPEDARYSVIRWLPSTTENASGPNVHDPRSGEILNAHVQFYQNAQRLVMHWYFTQAAAVDPRARKIPFPDDLMGELLRYVVAHEVGHTLGFQHNQKSSGTYPVDSLRSASFLRQWGHTGTLMDYSRWNYLVQPEDNVPPELLFPVIGPYDKWATHWGYAPITGARTPEAERQTLDTWAREQDTKPWLRFSTSDQGGSDPEDETEAVGDQDAVKATGWGLRNLKRIVPMVMPATIKPGEDNDDLEFLYGHVIGQWRTELAHVANIVGGSTSQEKWGGQPGPRFTPVPKARQQAAIRFLNENAFTTPTFLLDRDILRRLAPSGDVARIHAAQASILNSLLQNARLLRVADNAASARAGEGYAIVDLFADVRSGLFSDVGGGTIDSYRRALQRAYVENLRDKINPPPVTAAAGAGGRGGAAPAAPTLDPKLSDLYPAVRAELRALDAQLRAGAAKATDRTTRAHIDDLRFRVSEALKGKAGQGDEP